MSDKGISEDDWRAEIDRLRNCPRVLGRGHVWTEEEKKIVRYGYGTISFKNLLVVLNEANKKAGRNPRTPCGLHNHIYHQMPMEEDDVRHT